MDKRYKQLRNKSKLTLAAVSAATKINTSTLCRIENGMKPTFEQQAKLARFYGRPELEPKDVKLVSASEKRLLEQLQNHVAEQAKLLNERYCTARDSGEPIEFVEADLVVDCEFEPIRNLVLEYLCADYQKPDPKPMFTGQCF